jgi:hypothetical protein
MLNFHVLTKLLAQPNFVADPALTINSKVVLTTNFADFHYNGNSQGGIMGGVLMSSSQDISSGVLGVGGGPYALLLPRSSDFSDLFLILKLRYPASLDRMSIMGLMQALWDRMDPSGWAGYMSSGTLPNTPAHRVIMHYGLGDHQVTWLGAHAIAMSAGCKMFQSNVHEGNETLAQFVKVADSDVLRDGNLIMGFDFGFPVNPFVNQPPTSGPDAHECPRRAPEGQQQMAHFFETGEIINTCGGACVLNGCPKG